MLRRRDWCVRDAPSCPPHSAIEPRDSRLQQWTFAEARPVVVGIPVVLWCLLWSSLDLAKYLGKCTCLGTVVQSIQYPTPRCPRGMGGASSFPQASDVGSTGCAPLRAWFHCFRDRGCRPADGLAIHGAAINPPSQAVVGRRVVSVFGLGGGTCQRVCAQQGCSVPGAASGE